MLKKIAAGLGVIIAIILIIAAFRPDTYTVTRMITISAPPTTVFPYVNDLTAWVPWSPWAKIDPNMKSTFEGPTAGEGAIHAWNGNMDVGVGRMTITKSVPNEQIIIHMDFLEPMAGVATTEFNFKPVDSDTVVTWSISGKNNFLSRIMCMFMDMDKMIGEQFEKGLKDLKSVAEASKAS